MCLIRHPGWKKIPKNNKHPRTYIRNRRVSTQFMKAKKITNVNLVAKHLLKEDIWICTFTRFMKTTKTISLCQAIALKKHIYIIHEDYKNYKCELCEKNFQHYIISKIKSKLFMMGGKTTNVTFVTRILL